MAYTLIPVTFWVALVEERKSRDLLVHKDQRVTKVTLVQLDLEESKDLLAHRESRDLKEKKVTKGDTGEQGPQGPQGKKGDTGPAGRGMEYGHVVVCVHVININGGNAQSSDYTIHVNGNH